MHDIRVYNYLLENIFYFSKPFGIFWKKILRNGFIKTETIFLFKMIFKVFFALFKIAKIFKYKKRIFSVPKVFSQCSSLSLCHSSLSLLSHSLSLHLSPPPLSIFFSLFSFSLSLASTEEHLLMLEKTFSCSQNTSLSMHHTYPSLFRSSLSLCMFPFGHVLYNTPFYLSMPPCHLLLPCEL